MASQIALAVQNLPRNRRPRRVRPARFPRGIERQFVAANRDLVRAQFELVAQLLLPRLGELSRLAGVRQDEWRLDQSPWRFLLREILKDVRQRFEAAFGSAAETAEDAAREMSLFSRKEVGRQLRQVVGIDIFAESPELVDLLEQFVEENVARIRTTSAANFETIENIVSRGFRSGQRAGTVGDAITQALGVSESRAAFWARDQIGSLNGQLTRARQTAIGVDEYIWRTSRDERVRETHRRLEGTKHSWDDPPTVGQRQVHPGEDYNCRCLSGITVINGLPGLLKLDRRRHDGPGRVLTLASGVSLTVTPNHPILTRCGLQPAESLNVGDYVVAEVKQGGDVLEFDGKRYDVKIGELFAAFEKAGVARTVAAQPGSDFHGDATDQEIDLVSLDWKLMNEGQSAAVQKCREFGFADADQMAIVAFLRRTEPRDTWTGRGNMRRIELALALLRAHLSPFELFCLALGPRPNAGADEPETDAGPGRAEPLRDSILACARFVHGNNFINREIAAIRSGSPISSARIHAASTQVLRQDVRGDTYNPPDFNQGRAARYESTISRLLAGFT